MSRSIDPMAQHKAGCGLSRRTPRPHRFDESAAGYSLAGCSPAEPASASPANLIMPPLGWIRYAFSVNCNPSLISWPRRRGPVHLRLVRRSATPTHGAFSVIPVLASATAPARPTPRAHRQPQRQGRLVHQPQDRRANRLHHLRPQRRPLLQALRQRRQPLRRDAPRPARPARELAVAAGASGD